MSREILFIVGVSDLEEGDKRIRTRLEEELNFAVTVMESKDVGIRHLADKELIVLSSSIDKSHVSRLAKILREAPTPVLVLGAKLLKSMNMVQEWQPSNETIENALIVQDISHVLTGGLRGKVVISNEKRNQFYARPGSGRAKIKNGSGIVVEEKEFRCYRIIATLADDPESAALFAYEAGDIMLKEEQREGAITAPARRIAYMFSSKAAAEATVEGWKLFDAAVRWAVSLKTIDEIFTEEWQEIRDRRAIHYTYEDVDLPGGAEDDRPPETLFGLALSGGGIRSATFSLGLLQGFHETGVLRIFDYLSTVSGGGYVGGWWSAWLARERLGSTIRMKVSSGSGIRSISINNSPKKNAVSLPLKTQPSKKKPGQSSEV
jgi:hypothetical protein